LVTALVDWDNPVPAPRSSCPITGSAPAPTSPTTAPVDPDEAREFLVQFHGETGRDRELEPRLLQVWGEIERTGTYTHTDEELAFGARVAWRNSARCIGRLYWNSLRVRDRRGVRAPADVAAESIAHLREATRGGRIRSTITVFAPDRPDRPGPRIHNEQLVRYAAHRTAGGVRGDGRYTEFTDRVVALGWQRPDPPGRFDVLPLVVSDAGRPPQLFEVPPDAVLEVPIIHPEYDWFGELRLRWHAVPAISNMPLLVGGVRYPAAPFNGWYLGTEIGARNLADGDRYDLLPVIAELLGLDTGSPRTLWRDRAVVELVRAVHHSFDAAGATMADHHTESERFLAHVDRESAAGRRCPADWSWIVPPVSGGLTAVYHRYYDEPDPATQPAFQPPDPA
jgi:nitric-oxide synthase